MADTSDSQLPTGAVISIFCKAENFCKDSFLKHHPGGGRTGRIHLQPVLHHGGSRLRDDRFGVKLNPAHREGFMGYRHHGSLFRFGQNFQTTGQRLLFNSPGVIQTDFDALVNPPEESMIRPDDLQPPRLSMQHLFLLIQLSAKIAGDGLHAQADPQNAGRPPLICVGSF